MRRSQSINARAASAAGRAGSRLSRYRWLTLNSPFSGAGDDPLTQLSSRTAALNRRSAHLPRLEPIRPSRPDCISFRVNFRF